MKKYKVEKSSLKNRIKTAFKILKGQPVDFFSIKERSVNNKICKTKKEITCVAVYDNFPVVLGKEQRLSFDVAEIDKKFYSEKIQLAEQLAYTLLEQNFIEFETSGLDLITQTVGFRAKLFVVCPQRDKT